MMRISQQGLDLIKHYEGLRLEAYLCPANVWTIGYGHTKTARAGMEITAPEADRLLARDVAVFENVVKAYVKVGIEQHEYDALVCFAFNVGGKAFRDSTLLKKLNSGDKDEVPTQLMRWVYGGGKKLKGLVNRRRAEAALWRDLGAQCYGEACRVKPDIPKNKKPITQSKTAIASVIGTASGAAAVANEVADTVQNTVYSVQNITAVVPWFILGAVILAAGAFVIWDRYQKLKEGV